MKIHDSILEAIGNTPLVRLNRISKGLEAEILVKCEYLNPSGSTKDRIALKMIGEAEKQNRLQPGGTVTESSTGNTAIALSMVSAVKGYRSLMCMPKGWVSPDRKRILEAYGAEVMGIDPGEEIERELKGKDVHGGVLELLPRKKCLEMEKTHADIWWARQALNPDNIRAHRESTGREIIEQTDGKVDAFVCAVGTGGTLLGVYEALKEVNPAVKIYAVEPASSSLFEENAEISKYMKKYDIPGIEGWIISEIKKMNIVEKVYLVQDTDAVEMSHRLCKEEGLFCGMSSGANVHVAREVAKTMRRGQRVVTVLPDSRYRYFAEEHFTT
ncbi:MAG: cysteine synthase family protein [Desulfobacteraceae bacterium]|nr:MAG: cysteine synthase family protein [Desulfobacteraceae bacterium]